MYLGAWPVNTKPIGWRDIKPTGTANELAVCPPGCGVDYEAPIVNSLVLD